MEWRRGEIGLCPCSKYEFKQDDHQVQLVIHELDPDDSGDYICDSGDQKSTAHLEVKGRLKRNSLSKLNHVSFAAVSTPL